MDIFFHQAFFSCRIILLYSAVPRSRKAWAVVATERKFPVVSSMLMLKRFIWFRMKLNCKTKHAILHPIFQKGSTSCVRSLSSISSKLRSLARSISSYIPYAFNYLPRIQHTQKFLRHMLYVVWDRIFGVSFRKMHPACLRHLPSLQTIVRSWFRRNPLPSTVPTFLCSCKHMHVCFCSPISIFVCKYISKHISSAGPCKNVLAGQRH